MTNNKNNSEARNAKPRTTSSFVLFFPFPILLRWEYRQSIAFFSSVVKSTEDSLQFTGPSFCVIQLEWFVRAITKQNEHFIVGEIRSLKAWQKVVGALDRLPVLLIFLLYIDQPNRPWPSSYHSKSHLASSGIFLLTLGVWTQKGRRMSWILLWLVPAQQFW